MKNRFDLFTTLLVSFFGAILIGFTISPTTANTANLLPDNAYPATLVITEIQGNTLTLERFNTYFIDTDFCIDYTYVTDDLEDLYEGDIIAAVMLDLGKPEYVTDDAVIALQHSGYLP